MDCDAPADPSPILSGTDLIDRLSLLRPNLIRFSRFTFSGSAYAENPFTAYGNQKKALILPGGDATVKASLLDRVYGAATVGYNGGAYNISFYAYLRGGGTSGAFKAGFRDKDGGAITGIDDESFSVTDTPTLF